MELTSIATLLSILSGWTVFTEWRIRTMQAQMREKMEDIDKINQVIQGELKGDIARLEGKIDMLINLQMTRRNNGQSQS